jgi:hypothetical protein
MGKVIVLKGEMPRIVLGALPKPDDFKCEAGDTEWRCCECGNRCKPEWAECAFCSHCKCCPCDHE